jgi:hypothetical protein
MIILENYCCYNTYQNYRRNVDHVVTNLLFEFLRNVCGI